MLFSNKIPVVTPPPPPPLGGFIVGRLRLNPNAILVNPQHAGRGSTGSPDTNDLHGDYGPCGHAYENRIVTLRSGHFYVAGNTNVDHAGGRQVNRVAVGKCSSAARKHRERGAIVGLFTHINLLKMGGLSPRDQLLLRSRRVSCAVRASHGVGNLNRYRARGQSCCLSSCVRHDYVGIAYVVKQRGYGIRSGCIG